MTMLDNHSYRDSALAVVERASRPIDDLVAAVAQLPLPAPTDNRRWNLHTTTVAWLDSFESEHTKTAYLRDLTDYVHWCDDTGLDPRNALRADVDMYASMRLTGTTRSKARRLSALSSWYRYLLSNDVTDRNPLDAVKRPRYDRTFTPTVAMSSAEATAFMRAARSLRGPCSRRHTAVLAMLIELGLRIGEALALDFDAFRHNLGHRTVVVLGKGNKPRELAIPAPLARDLDAYTNGRTEGPVFITSTGSRLAQSAVFRLVRRVATIAGLPAAERFSPHSLRHTALTAMFDAGASLRDVQHQAGHVDPRTTELYDHNRGQLDRSPAYLIAGLFAHDEEP